MPQGAARKGIGDTMGFTVGNAQINGTYLQGEIITTRAEIEAVFGPPNYEDSDPTDKVITEWDITFDDGTVATIYDWKRYDEGPVGMHESYSWHIGGASNDAVDYVLAALRGAEYDSLPHTFHGERLFSYMD
jgi:hypothetical protein